MDTRFPFLQLDLADASKITLDIIVTLADLRNPRNPT